MINSNEGTCSKGSSAPGVVLDVGACVRAIYSAGTAAVLRCTHVRLITGVEGSTPLIRVSNPRPFFGFPTATPHATCVRLDLFDQFLTPKVLK